MIKNPFFEEDNEYHDPNDDPSPKDDVFDLDEYVPNNFPERVNDGNDTYENNNFGNANYYAPLKEYEEQKYNNDKEPMNDVDGTNDGDDDDNNNEHSENAGVHEKTYEITGVNK